jgi:hypothetical protein
MSGSLASAWQRMDTFLDDWEGETQRRAAGNKDFVQAPQSMATSIPGRVDQRTPSERRITALDILRGFAICGVIAANYSYSFEAA